MGATVGLILLTVLCASVGGVTGACRVVQNDDMIEYSCVGGQPADLNDLPAATGKIRITNMPMPRVTKETFSKFGSELWVLSCSHCGIVDIEPGAFQHLENLQQLSLDSNHLTTVKESWFEGLDFLTYLDLNYNKIRTIENGVFENMPSLVDLRLSGNRLECLNLEDMSHLTELRRIFLSENFEFKCPNAVSSFLDGRGVNFERDPEWHKIPQDLVRAEIPSDYTKQDQRLTSTPSPPVPTFRERLHLPPITTAAPEQPRPYEIPSRIYPTRQQTNVHPSEYTTPYWRTPPESTPPSPSYYERYPTRPTTMTSTHEETYSHEETRAPYIPPRVVETVETVTYPPYVTTPRTYDVTTMRSWPRVPESGTSFGRESALYPPHENENKHYGQAAYPSEVTRSPSLAPSPIDHQETPFFVEPGVDRTSDPYKTYWIPDENEAFSGMRYPTDNEEADHSVTATEAQGGGSTHFVRPLPSIPEMIQPASPGDLFQAPYNEPTVTIRPPPFINYQQQEETTTAQSMETTTDKPLPECPNSSTSIARSFQMIVISVLLVVMKNVVVEGF